MDPDHRPPHELIDIITRYYPHVNLRDYGPEQEYDPAYIAYVENTPEYQALSARLDQGVEEFPAWRAFVDDRLKPQISDVTVRDNTIPGDPYYEVIAYFKGEPLADGDLSSELAARVSLLAPVYEIYERRSYIERSVLPDDPVRYRDHHYTHDIAERFQPAAEVLAREIEERFGYQQMEPGVFDIVLLNLAVPGYLINEPTIGDALFARHL